MNTQQLKDKILQMAIQGKLVKQEPNDEPAKELLKRIKQEKEQLIKEKKIKKPKVLHPIEDDEKHFDIPDSWEWVRLGTICLLNPRNSAPDDVEASFVPMSYIGDGYNNLHNQDTMLWKDIKSGFTHFAENDIAVAKITPCFENKKSVIMKNLVNGIGAGTTELYIIRPLSDTINPEFLFSIFKMDAFVSAGVSTYTGTAGQQRVKKEFVANYPVPLPPTEEQQRIVEKIDVLFTLIDTLEGNKEEMLKAIKETRNKVLDEAIRGNLVEQNPNDEPALELLKRVRIEKEKMVKDKKNKNNKELHLITDEEKPYDIPENWMWIRLGDIGRAQTGTTPSTKNEDYFGGKVPFIKPADISAKGIKYSNDSLTELGLHMGREISRHSNLMVCIGGSIGKTYYTDRVVSCNQQINTVTPFAEIDYKYVHICLTSVFFYRQVVENATGTATPIIKKSKWENLLIPMPPVQEQKRIVEKAERTFMLIECVEAQLSN